MERKMIGLHPELAGNFAVYILDKAQTDDEKVALLLNNTPVPKTELDKLPPEFASGVTFDIFVGELLGMAMVGMYYGWSAGDDNRYQVAVGLEDNRKREVETLLSDGAIWDNQTEKHMVFQQVTAQGYYPQKDIGAHEVALAINKKTSIREQYPDSCGLVVNVYAAKMEVDFEELASLCDLSSYTHVLLNWYAMPEVLSA
jgi:sulfur carrier protein ThiS